MRFVWAATVCAALCASATAGPGDEVRKRILTLHWGGGEKAAWRGEVRVDGGRLLSAKPSIRYYGPIFRVGGLYKTGFKFDDPKDAFTRKGDVCRWTTSARKGRPDGLVLNVEAGPRTRFMVTWNAPNKGKLTATLADLLKSEATAPASAKGRVALRLVYTEPKDPAKIAKLKRLFLKTDLVAGGKPRAPIVIPKRNSTYASLAAKLVAKVKAESGATLPVIDDAEVVDAKLRPVADHFRKTDLVVLGNINTSRTAALLYGNRYCFADGAWPGGDAFVVRTIHDPFGHGRNVLFLGASGDRGLGRAVAWLLPRLKGPDITLGHVQHIEGLRRSYWQAMGDAEFQGRARRRSVRYAIEAGLDASVSNCDNRLIERVKTLVRNCMAPCLARRHDYHVTWRVGALVSVWDLLEEDPRFDDAFRLEVTNFLLDMARGCFELKPRRLADLVREGQTGDVHAQNHMTVSARACYLCGRYFQKYYGLEEADFWVRLAEVFFRGMNTTHQIAENACAYGWANPEVAASYALMAPDTTYFDKGIARVHADLAVMATNNLGFTAGYGDCPNYIYDPKQYKTIMRAAWYYRNGGYQWIIENLYPKRGVGVLAPRGPVGPAWTPLYGLTVCYGDAKPVEPKRFLGVRVQPLYAAPTDWYQGGYDAKPQPFKPLPRVFDKITFRAGFGRMDQYMMLAGRRGGGHMHSDMNSIVNLTDNGRLWIADSTYAQRAPEDHSGCVLMLQGVKLRSNRSAELEVVEDLDTVGFTRTLHPGLGGAADWRRSILWDKERFFLVFDELASKRPDDALARCYFRCLGKPSLTGARFTVTQKGEAFHVCADGSTRLRVRDVPVIGTQRSTIRGYPYAGPTRRVLEQTKTSPDLAARPIVIKTLLAPTDSGATRRVTLTKYRPVPRRGRPPALASLDERTAVFEADGLLGLAGVDATVRRVGPFVVTAEAFLLSPERVVLIRGRLVTLNGETLFEAGRPVSLEWDTRLGYRQVVTDAPTHIRFRGSRQRFDVTRGGKASGAMRVYSVEPDPVTLKALGDAFAKLPRPSASGAKARRGKRRLEGARVAWSRRLPASPTAVKATRDGLLVALADKRLVRLTSSGKERGRFALPSTARAIAVGDLNGKTGDEIAIGLDDRTVRAFSTDGRALWTYGPMPESEGRNMYGRSAPNIIRGVAVTDLDGDGKAEVVAGAGYPFALDRRGKLLWAFKHLHRTDGLRAIGVGDLTGDGKREIVAADRWTYHHWYLLDAKGRPLDGDGRVSYGPKRMGLKAAPVAVAIGRLLPGGKGMAACADASGVVSLAAKRGGRARGYSVGDAPTAMLPCDLDGDGVEVLLVGAESHYVFALNGKARPVWRLNVGGPVVGVAAVPGAKGRPGFAAVATDAETLLVDAKGKVVGRYADPSLRPAFVAALKSTGRVVIVGKNGQVVGLDRAGR